MPSLREQVYARDQGVCAECGIDTEAVTEMYRLMVERPGLFRWCYDAFGILLRKAGFIKPHLWEMDHEHPKNLDGPETLDNCRTLCVPCHQAKTNSEGPRNQKIRRVQAKRRAGKM